MNKPLELLDLLKTGTASWEDYSNLLKLKKIELEPFFAHCQEITNNIFDNTLKIYNPTKKFPAISITGSKCALQCSHCNMKYLKSMKQISNNDDLETFLIDLANNNGIGALISGGSQPDGSVPITKFLDTIKKVKKQTKLIINTHTGLLSEETAKKLAKANVDIVSFNVNADEEIIKNIYHLKKGVKDYKKSVDLLKKYNLNIVPHLCIGLYYGKLHKELESIKFIKDLIPNPSLIVIIALIPPKNSNVYFERPDPLDIAKVTAVTRILFPHTELSLGCMRPRGDVKVEIEKYAIKAGINRIEIPSRDTIKWLKEYNPQAKLEFFSACCAIPKEFEDFATSKNHFIRRYLIK
jgi:uncharacterized radical SAM superfamily protein